MEVVIEYVVDELLPEDVAKLDYVQAEFVDLVVDVVRGLADRKKIIRPEDMEQLLCSMLTQVYYDMGMGISEQIFGHPQLPIDGGRGG